MQTIKRNLFLLFTLLLAVLVVAACAPASTPAPTDVPPTPTALQMPTTAPAASTEAATAPATTEVPAQTNPASSDELTGASLYQISCMACHGADHAGKTFDKDGNKISTPSLSWSELSQTYATDASRGSVADQVAMSITKGLDETGSDLNAMMPRWSTLSKTQVDSLTQYLQSADTTGALPTLAPAATNLMGEQLYQAACSACHGADGAGKTFEKDGGTISTPSLHWSELSKTYSADPSRGSVADQVAISITKGLDETGSDLNDMMPRWSFLSKAQVDSLVQYLQTAFK